MARAANSEADGSIVRADRIAERVAIRLRYVENTNAAGRGRAGDDRGIGTCASEGTCTLRGISRGRWCSRARVSLLDRERITYNTAPLEAGDAVTKTRFLELSYLALVLNRRAIFSTRDSGP